MLYLRRERNHGLDECLDDIAETVDLMPNEYVTQLKEDPTSLANSLAAVEIKEK